MVGPGLIGGNARQHLAAPAAAVSLVIPTEAGTSVGKRSRKTNFVDPCVVAPLKKRRIQVRERERDILTHMVIILSHPSAGGHVIT